MPINMVSHTHGQGYADSHFIIPETIENTTYKKGVYDVEKEDLAVTGFVDFHITYAISTNMLKVEAGQFNIYRVLGMVDLLGKKPKQKTSSGMRLPNTSINLRLDATANSELSHTVNQTTLINPVKLGVITEFSAGAYLSETVNFNQKLNLNAGLRFDRFYHQYNNKLASDSTLNGTGIYTAKNSIVSPKLNFYYQATGKAQFYLFMGKGFHSNNARAVVAEKGLQMLPAAYGTDLGMVFKPVKNVLVNAALWYSYLQKEYVYAGDGGTVDFIAAVPNV